MCQVKYLFGGTDPEEIELARQMQDAGVDFVCAPTSGPVTIWVDGAVEYGPTAVRGVIRDLIAKAQGVTAAAM